MKMFCSHLFVRLFEIAIKSLMALLSTFILYFSYYLGPKCRVPRTCFLSYVYECE